MFPLGSRGGGAAGQELTTGVIFQLTRHPLLAKEQKENYVPFTFWCREVVMLRVFVEEAAALASIGLFLGMVAVWAQLIPQL